MITVSTAAAAIRMWTEAWDCSDDVSRDVAFHLSDWLQELKVLAELLAAPEQYTSDQARKAVIDFLVHAVPHLAAASALLIDTPVEDTFDVGAIRCVHEASKKSGKKKKLHAKKRLAKSKRGKRRS